MNPKNFKKIYDATFSEEGYLMATSNQYLELADLGYVELNPNINNGLIGATKKIAVRVTKLGKEVFEKTFDGNEEIPYTSDVDSNESEVKSNPKKRSNDMSQFPLESVEFIPAVSRRSVERGSKYPFDIMEVNQRFYVDGADAVKKIQSAMGNANKKYSTPVVDEEGNVVTKLGRKGDLIPVREQIREFTCRAVRDEAGAVIGAHVYRSL